MRPFYLKNITFVRHSFITLLYNKYETLYFITNNYHFDKLLDCMHSQTSKFYKWFRRNFALF